MARSGTSWVGKMLDASGKTVYINEPLNVAHPPGRSPGVLSVDVRQRYPYITDANESEYVRPFERLFMLRYDVYSELRANHSVYDLLRAGKYWSSFTRGRVRGRRPLVDDPYAVFAAPWLRRRFGALVVAVVRHPAALVQSRMRLGWTIDFRDLLHQPLLVQDWLNSFRDDMLAMTRVSHDPLAESALLWRMIYHAVDRFRQRLDGVIVIRHEDLASDPVGEYKRLFGHLKIPWTDRVHDAVVAGSMSPTRASRSHGSHPLTTLGRSISRSGFRPLNSKAHAVAWKHQLSRTQIDRIRRLTSDVADAFYTDEDWFV